ncbi:hypothetical protein Patl1_09257 [Pistacia atlantica]|uniref:Uncharacterized protein n=1 Tax=Pistacia atlantica TaxID=434234 RepID=A0ACC1AFF5_9ROSI|nr:hypothetical protein Patl1_09257 [Pistacia atlantica]
MGIAIKEVIRFSLRVNPSTNNNSNNQTVNTQHSSPILASSLPSTPHLLHFSLFHMQLPYLRYTQSKPQIKKLNRPIKKLD